MAGSAHDSSSPFPPDDFSARLWRPEAVGVHLRRTDENATEIAELERLLGTPVGVEGLLDDLKWKLRRSLSGRLLGRAVSRAWRFDRYDERDPRWWPQGMTCAPRGAVPAGRDVVVTTWYSKELDAANHGSRVTFVDLASRRYRHVLLVEPVRKDGRLVLKPLHIHAGGIAWIGDRLHVAATGRGFYSFDVADVMRVGSSHLSPEAFGIGEDHQVSSYGHRYVLPVRSAWRAEVDEPAGQAKLRYSFLSVDSSTDPPLLLAGEYGRGTQSTRLARFRVDPGTGAPALGEDGVARPVEVDLRGARQMQGVARAGGRVYVSVSQGPWVSGTVLVGRPGAFRPFRLAVPMGPEDLDHRASDDTLWTVTEHPWRRWIVQVERSWFDRH